jgi:hypothetical protein
VLCQPGLASSPCGNFCESLASSSKHRELCSAQMGSRRVGTRMRLGAAARSGFGSAADAEMMYLNLETYSAREVFSSDERMHVGRPRHMTCRDERHVNL